MTPPFLTRIFGSMALALAATAGLLHGGLYNKVVQIGMQRLISKTCTVFMFDRTGRQRYFLNADDPNCQFTTRDVEDALATLVSEPAGS